MADTDTFEEHLLGVVDMFLQTVVVVDDRAFNDPPPVVDEPAQEAVSSSGARGRGVQSGLQRPVDQAGDEHDLDAKQVTDAFARRGLVCGLLSPAPGEELGDELVRTARRADLVVLDWVVDRDDGRKALELLRRILESDSVPPSGRLRTIAVYTGQHELRVVAGRLKEALGASYPGALLIEHDDGLAMTKGPVRVAVFAKEHVSQLAPDLESRRVRFDELPDRLRREFAALTSGIVTAVALAALAALRDDTHRVLSVVNPRLDVAYLGHRSVLPEPEDAQSQVVALVASELRAVIEDHKVGDLARETILFLWLAASRGDGTKLGELIDPAKPIPRAQVEGMLRFGLGSSLGLTEVADLGSISKTHLKDKVKTAATQVFALTLDEANGSDSELANRMMLRTTYSSPPRMLQLGTVVEAPDRAYWICVQPVCDSVRLRPEVRAFPFLRLQTSDRSRFQFVVTDATDTEQFLVLTKNPRDLVVARFKPRAGKSVIEATEARGSYLFRDTGNKRYRWVAQLKTEFAQKVAVDLANEIAQVAVDEAELRRLSVS
jgi:hypothetical protein